MSTHHVTTALQLTLIITLSCLTGAVPMPATASAANDLDTFIARLEGGWEGNDNLTPFGKMPFAMLFERQADGSLHSRSSLNSETYIDVRFSKDNAGRWILHEEAAMEDMGSQEYSLVPADGTDGMHRWVHDERPDFLAIDLGLEDETMIMAVTLRGREHVRFELDRVPEDELATLRAEFAAAAHTPPSDGNSISDVVENFPGARSQKALSDDDPITQARQMVASSPADAQAYLALAKTLGNAINSDPAYGPIHASELYQSLRKSIELDPHLAEAYHWLVGYYLNAPPIAGGSVTLAEETARQLAAFDAEGAAPLLEQIASRKAALQ
jgi:hypothetical protein